MHPVHAGVVIKRHRQQTPVFRPFHRVNSSADPVIFAHFIGCPAGYLRLVPGARIRAERVQGVAVLIQQVHMVRTERGLLHGMLAIVRDKGKQVRRVRLHLVIQLMHHLRAQRRNRHKGSHNDRQSNQRRGHQHQLRAQRQRERYTLKGSAPHVLLRGGVLLSCLRGLRGLLCGFAVEQFNRYRP